VGRGPCEVREKIRNDTFRCVEEVMQHADDGSYTLRTLATDRGFKSRVREDMLVRLLDAFVWRSQGALSPPCIYLPLMCVVDRLDTHELGFTYVQGMNVLAAPFLYTMPSEMEAFFCFAAFIENCCPLYVQPTLEGVHRGLKVHLLFSS
jgi:cell cycle arrest protein BUB2